MNEALKDARQTQVLFRIVGFSTAFAFGAMVASLFAVKNTPAGLVFELTVGSIIAFLAAGTVAWFYWRMVERLTANVPAGAKGKFPPKFAAFSAALLLIGVAAFLYPLRFVPEEKRGDVFSGLLLAALVLSAVGFVMWKVRNFLEADTQRTEREERHE